MCGCLGVTQCEPTGLFVCTVTCFITRLIFHFPCFAFTFDDRLGNWLKRSSLSGLTDGVEDLLDISSVDRLSFIRQSSKVSCRLWTLSEQLVVAGGETSRQRFWSGLLSAQVKFTSAVKLSEGGAVGPEYSRDEEENFFKRLGKWRSGRRNPSKLHHTEEKDGRPYPPRGAPHHPSHAHHLSHVPFTCVSPALCMCVWWSALPACSALPPGCPYSSPSPQAVRLLGTKIRESSLQLWKKKKFFLHSQGNFFLNYAFKLAKLNKFH